MNDTYLAFYAEKECFYKKFFCFQTVIDFTTFIQNIIIFYSVLDLNMLFIWLQIYVQGIFCTQNV